MADTVIGRIVKSNSHTDYVCQVFAPHEREYDPKPEDYAFGRFVAAPIDAAARSSFDRLRTNGGEGSDVSDGGSSATPRTNGGADGDVSDSGSLAGPETSGGERTAVGIVYDTILLNPEYGSLGPRLNPPGDQAMLAPDYLVEKATAVGILIVGLREGGATRHGVVPYSLSVDAEVASMDDDETRRFHQVDGQLSLGYLPQLISHQSPLVTELGLSVIRHLLTLFDEPGDRRLLHTLAAHLSWQARVAPLG